MEALNRRSRRFGLSRLWLPALLGLMTGAGCSTNAVGVTECRDVEYARCEASAACGVIDASEVEECKRFYRDHCLHGIAGDEVPTADDHQACIDLIEEAGKSAEESLGMGGSGEPDEDACEVVAKPWDSDECAYLQTTSSSMGGGE